MPDSMDEDEKLFVKLQSGAAQQVDVVSPRPKIATLSGGCERQRRRDRFVQVPLWWAERVIETGGTSKTLFVSIWLLHLAWKTKSSTVALPNGQLEARGIDRKAKRRALRQLEAAGLIRIDRRHGKTPIVTVVLV